MRSEVSNFRPYRRRSWSTTVVLSAAVGATALLTPSAYGNLITIQSGEPIDFGRVALNAIVPTNDALHTVVFVKAASGRNDWTLTLSSGLTASSTSGQTGNGNNATFTIDFGLNNSATGTGSLGTKSYTAVLNNTSDATDPNDTVHASVTVINDRSITQTVTPDFGRFVNGQIQAAKTATISSTGAHANTADIRVVNAKTVTTGGAQLVTGAGQQFNFADAAAHTFNINVSITGALASLGTQTFNTLQLTTANSALAGESGMIGQTVAPVTISYTADAVTNRTFTITGATDTPNFGRFMQSRGSAQASKTVNISSSGVHDTTADQTLNAGFVSSGGVTLTNAVTQAYLGDSATQTGTLAVSLDNSVTTGTRTTNLTFNNMTGETGLTGQTLNNVPQVAVTTDAVIDRTFTQTATPNFGRFMNGQTQSARNATISSTGSHDTTADVTVVASKTISAGGAQVATDTGQAFTFADGLAHTKTVSVSITGALASLGTQTFNTLQLTTGNTALTGESPALTGQTVAPITIGYIADAVTDRAFTQTVTPNFGRFINGQTQAAKTATISSTGSHDTTADVTVVASKTISAGGAQVATGLVQVFNFADAAAHAKDVSVSIIGSLASLGTQTFNTLQLTTGNAALTGESPVLTGQTVAPITVSYIADAVSNRTLSITDGSGTPNFGRFVQGQGSTVAAKTVNVSSSGLHDITADETINAGTVSSGAGGVAISSAASQGFLGASATDTGSLSVSLGNSVTLGSRTTNLIYNLVSGETGLIGQTIGNVPSVAVTTNAVLDRTFSQTVTPNFGRFINGQAQAAQVTTISSTGLRDVTADLKINGSQMISSGGAQIATGAGTTFNGPDSAAHSYSVNLSINSALASTGTQTHSLQLTAANGGLTGETNLQGQTVAPITISYIADAVANRAIVADAVNLGQIIVGHTAATNITGGIGANDSFTTPSVLGGVNNALAGGVTLNSGAGGALDASHTSRQVSLTFSSVGSVSDTQDLRTVANAVLAGEGLTGESLNNGSAVSLAYSADVLDHAKASFASAADQNNLAISLTGMGPDQWASQAFSLYNLLGFRAGLQFVSIEEISDPSQLFDVTGSFAGVLAAGQSTGGTTPFAVNFSGAGESATPYTASYAIHLIDQNLPGATAQTLTISVAATVTALPEPGTGVLAISMAGLSLSRQRRRSWRIRRPHS